MGGALEIVIDRVAALDGARILLKWSSRWRTSAPVTAPTRAARTSSDVWFVLGDHSMASSAIREILGMLPGWLAFGDGPRTPEERAAGDQHRGEAVVAENEEAWVEAILLGDSPEVADQRRAPEEGRS